jgi:hypothetical protein
VRGKNDIGSLPLQAADLFAFEYHLADRSMKHGQKDFSKLRYLVPSVAARM